MKPCLRFCGAVLACLLSLAACKDRHEPVKPTAAPPAFATPPRA